MRLRFAALFEIFQHRQFKAAEARPLARFDIHMAAENKQIIAADQRAKQRHRLQAALGAQIAIPIIAGLHMPYFIAVNNVQHVASGRIAALRHFGAYGRGNVQPARFEHARHQRHAQKRVERSFIGHVPQMIVRLEIAVIKAVRIQAAAHQRKMISLFFGHAQPIGGKRGRQRPKAVSRIERQINGVEFDMANSVQHRRITLWRAHFALLHLIRCHQIGLLRPAGPAEILRGGSLPAP